MLDFPHNQSRLIMGLAILVALVLIASGCQGAQPGTPAPQAATEEATEEPAEEATHEATAEATHEATEEATHEASEEFEDLENPFAGDPDAIAAGQEIYLNNCALCHGETGMGDGPAAPGLPEEPSKFADCEWQSHEPDGELFHVIVNGEPEEGMPAWGETLTEDQIWQVLSYERSFCPDLVIEAEATHEATAEATHEATAEATHEATAEATHEATAEATHEASEEFEDLENPFAGDPDAIAAGKEIYQANCALCHGETGMGDGPAAPGLPEEPSKFADCEMMAQMEEGELFHVIVNGEPEEGMPAWGETLTEDRIWQVLSYERSFCE
ncbi:MAG: Cbb3-type cytochrome c oxidase subunit CcoP1 [Anaerolineales bacterium]|nr:Cbb3-type cytochrome c oxidase subunit CcoP1 [Anaerolineales bacterium]